MINHTELTAKDVRKKIRQKEICFGGNQQLKIYGTLQCKSGKRLKEANRIFFASEREAIENGFRPCGHCMKTAYQQWIYSATKQTAQKTYCRKTAL
jgi:methylphosphotriester-DNA--protein-cysteine methyltransferase